jgi:hypothetical protein
MGSWIKCGYGCGNCRLSIDHEDFLFINPVNILEWAHSVIDLVEDSLGRFTGIPLQYFITCTHGAYTQGQIAPCNDPQYTRSHSFNNDLISQSISTISHSMMSHSVRRKHVAGVNSAKYMILSIDDLMSFQEHMLTQSRFSIIHAGLDEISIVKTNEPVRVQRNIRLKKSNKK